MDIAFKPADHEDTSDILGFMEEFYNTNNYPFDPDSSRKALIQLLQDENLGRAWMISFEGEMVGYLVLTFGYSLEYRGKDAFLDELFLSRSFRSRGIGTSF